MADISPPQIERIGDPSGESRENASPQHEAKTLASGKPAPREALKTIPKIEPAEESHKLDEMA